MQYPQIQFYRGSLVRLASGKLKQVEDLSSDDFIESARLAGSSLPDEQQSSNTRASFCPAGAFDDCFRGNSRGNHASNNHVTKNSFSRNQQQLISSNGPRGSSGQLDDNNNSAFDSPEPTSSFDSPTMELEGDDDDEIELDVVTNDNEPSDRLFGASNSNAHAAGAGNAPFNRMVDSGDDLSRNNLDEDFYIDSSVVRDFLEVSSTHLPPSSTSPASSTGSTSSLAVSPRVSAVQRPSFAAAPSQQIVLIKFFLESSRSVAFIEVPSEHPFFVFHRGWSSWNPQRTYEKFGLKCRKLKIGDTCISLIRKRRKQMNPNQQQDSDQCNILFSSIRIHE